MFINPIIMAKIIEKLIGYFSLLNSGKIIFIVNMLSKNHNP